MKQFEVNMKVCVNAIDEENVKHWLNNFVLPHLKEICSDGNLLIGIDIKEI